MRFPAQLLKQAFGEIWPVFAALFILCLICMVPVYLSTTFIYGPQAQTYVGKTIDVVTTGSPEVYKFHVVSAYGEGFFPFGNGEINLYGYLIIYQQPGHPFNMPLINQSFWPNKPKMMFVDPTIFVHVTNYQIIQLQ